jgi:hypothetical protein
MQDRAHQWNVPNVGLGQLLKKLEQAQATAAAADLNAPMNIDLPHWRQ